PNPRKAAYAAKDLDDWSRLYGLRIRMPPSVFPVNSVKCMRGAFVSLDADKLVRDAGAARALYEYRSVPCGRAAFESYWGEDQDISQPSVLSELARRAGLEVSNF